MHVLFVPSIYPTADEPWRGTDVRDQALALARSGVKVGVAFVERRSLGKLNPATLVANAGLVGLVSGVAVVGKLAIVVVLVRTLGLPAACLLLCFRRRRRRSGALDLLRKGNLQLRKRIPHGRRLLTRQDGKQRPGGIDAQLRLLYVLLPRLLRRARHPEPASAQVDQRHDRLKQHVLDRDPAHLLLERRAQLLVARLRLAHVVTPSTA